MPIAICRCEVQPSPCCVKISVDLLNANKQRAVSPKLLLFVGSTQAYKEWDGQHGVVKVAG